MKYDTGQWHFSFEELHNFVLFVNLDRLVSKMSYLVAKELTPANIRK
jgi:hypothetical protein